MFDVIKEYIAFFLEIIVVILAVYGCYKLIESPTPPERAPQSYMEIEKVPIRYDSSQAPEYLGKALYKELEFDKILNKLSYKYINEDIRPYVGYTTTVLKISAERRITWKWEF